MSELSSSMAAEVGDPRAPDLRGLGIMQLLKQASRRRGSSTGTAASSTASSPNAGLEVALARLAGTGTTRVHTCSMANWTVYISIGF